MSVLIFRLYTVSPGFLRKSHNPVSVEQEGSKFKGLFVIIKSIQERYTRFLQQVGSSMKDFNPYNLQKDYIQHTVH